MSTTSTTTEFSPFGTLYSTVYNSVLRMYIHCMDCALSDRTMYVCMYVALCRAAQQRQEDLYTNVEEGRGIILLGFLNAAVESADLHFGYHCNRWFLISGRSLPSPQEVVYVGARA